MHIHSKRYIAYGVTHLSKKYFIHLQKTELTIPLGMLRKDNQMRTPRIAVFLIMWFVTTLHRNH